MTAMSDREAGRLGDEELPELVLSQCPLFGRSGVALAFLPPASLLCFIALAQLGLPPHPVVALLLCIPLLLPWPALFVGIFFTRPARFTFTPATLQVTYWAGILPHTVTRSLPLSELRFWHSPQLGSAIARLRIERKGEVVSIGGLRASREDIAALTERVERATAQARARIGEAEAEIPADLRSMVRSAATER